MAVDRSPAQTALLPASQALDPARSVPVVLERAGAKALFAANEFFAARISNPHTRRAYARVVSRFLAWCEEERLDLSRVSPGLAGRFIDELPGDSATKNQALAALRHFFDTLVMHSLQSLKYKPLIIIDLLRISPLQFPHYIPLFEKEPTGRSRMLADRSAEYQP